ncbi:MAG: hypothetical protein OEW09_06455, partial [Anaerolineae bacterium]|nr:hypothetical protein [Anaerolineae bacterium]
MTTVLAINREESAVAWLKSGLETAGFRVITAHIYQFTGEDSMVKRRTWFILVVAMLLAAVGGYVAYIHFLAPAG